MPVGSTKPGFTPYLDVSEQRDVLIRNHLPDPILDIVTGYTSNAYLPPPPLSYQFFPKLRDRIDRIQELAFPWPFMPVFILYQLLFRGAPILGYLLIIHGGACFTRPGTSPCPDTYFGPSTALVQVVVGIVLGPVLVLFLTWTTFLSRTTHRWTSLLEQYLHKHMLLTFWVCLILGAHCRTTGDSICGSRAGSTAMLTLGSFGTFLQSVGAITRILLRFFECACCAPCEKLLGALLLLFNIVVLGGLAWTFAALGLVQDASLVGGLDVAVVFLVLAGLQLCWAGLFGVLYRETNSQKRFFRGHRLLVFVCVVALFYGFVMTLATLIAGGMCLSNPRHLAKCAGTGGAVLMVLPLPLLAFAACVVCIYRIRR